MKNINHINVFIPYEGSNGPQKAMVDKINELVDEMNALKKENREMQQEIKRLEFKNNTYRV